MSIKVWALAAAAVVGLGVSVAADHHVGFSLFGQAQEVTGGTEPGEEAVDLTSSYGGTYSGVKFVPDNGHPFTLADLTTLSTDYNVGATDCGGGSPRFQIDLATNQNIFVYIGPVPNFTGCSFGWQKSGNVVNALDARWDTTQLGGAFYDTHADALVLAGGTAITEIDLVVDAGWFFANKRGQDVTVDNFTVNNKVMHVQ